VEVYVVKSLVYGILLRNSFLTPNKLDFIQVKSATDFARLEFQGKKIRISVQSKQQKEYSRAQIYVAETVTIYPGTGLNIKVRHRTLPNRPAGYLINPTAQRDLATNTYGSLINAIVDGTPRPLPYSNFGHTPIKLKTGQIIGLLDRVEGEVTSAENIYLSLTEVF